MYNVRFKAYDILIIVLLLVIMVRGLFITDTAIVVASIFGLTIFITKLLVIMDTKKQYKKEVLKHGKRS